MSLLKRTAATAVTQSVLAGVVGIVVAAVGVIAQIARTVTAAGAVTVAVAVTVTTASPVPVAITAAAVVARVCEKVVDRAPQLVQEIHATAVSIPVSFVTAAGIAATSIAHIKTSVSKIFGSLP